MATTPRQVRDRSTVARLLRWAGEWRQAIAVAVSRSRRPKTGRIYDVVGTQNLFGEESLFINMGYWKNNPNTWDEASGDLARLLAHTADFNAVTPANPTFLGLHRGGGPQSVDVTPKTRPTTTEG
jgi:hypothetical protein